MSLAFADFEEKSRLRALLDHFSIIEDPREAWRVAHPLPEVLLLVVCGTIADCDDFDAIALWGEAHLAFLRRYLPYEQGVPCGRWLNLLMNRIDPALFSAAFTAWVRETWPDRPDFVAIDGKTSRRSHDRADGRGAAASGLRLRHHEPPRARAGGGRGQEQRAFGDPGPARAARRRRRTERRAGLHRRHRHQRQNRPGDRGRRRRLSAGGQSQPAEPARGDEERLRCRRAGRRRPSRRSRQGAWPHRTADRQRHREVDWLDGDRRFPGELRLPGASCVMRVEIARRACPTAAACETRYYISSARLSAERAAEAVRGHWGIENRLHWVLDMVFKEDQSRLRKGHGAKNMAVVRHFAINLVTSAPEPVRRTPLKPQRKATKPRRTSIKLRRKIAGWNPDYLSTQLGATPR